MDRHEEELTDERPRRGLLRRRLAQGLLAIALIAVGLAGGVVWSERRAAKQGSRGPSASVDRTTESDGASARAGGASMPGMPGMPAGRPDQPAAQGEEAAEVSLTPEALERAGIKTAVVRSGVADSATTVPGTVMSNAYRDTKVSALVGGVVRHVSAELGAAVQRGQPLAVIFSSELAEAQMKYLSMRAMVEADRLKRQRTDRLVALGAASRQELEEITAVHASRETEVAAARQRLLLLGLSPQQVAELTEASHVVSEVTVPAPAAGVVIARSVNPGQVVMAGQDLFVVTDLNSVWVIGDLYEKDFARVAVGSPASVAIPSAPQNVLRGRVAYIDPRVDPTTRTAKVRVEVPNRGGELRLGMFVTVSFETVAGPRVTLVPRSAVQAIGERAVVYVVPNGDEARFVERTVKLGSVVGDSVEVLEGLKPGDRVVVEGSFFIRAEAARTRTGE